MTLALGAVVRVIGDPDKPDRGKVTVSWYVPEDTSTVCPAWATATPLPIVQKGSVAVPAPLAVSEHVTPLLTYHVVVAAPAGAGSNQSGADHSRSKQSHQDRTH